MTCNLAVPSVYGTEQKQGDPDDDPDQRHGPGHPRGDARAGQGQGPRGQHRLPRRFSAREALATDPTTTCWRLWRLTRCDWPNSWTRLASIWPGSRSATTGKPGSSTSTPTNVARLGASAMPPTKRAESGRPHG